MSNKIKCSHILVQKQSEALAILERIKKKEKFGKLAKELSIDSGSAKRDIGLASSKGTGIVHLSKMYETQIPSSKGLLMSAGRGTGIRIG